MKKLNLVGLLLVGLWQPAQAWTISRYDCVSFSGWAVSNAEALAYFTKSLVPLVGSQGDWLPNAKLVSDISYIGLGVGIAKGFVQLGGSPLGATNLLLHLGCYDLQR